MLSDLEEYFSETIVPANKQTSWSWHFLKTIIQHANLSTRGFLEELNKHGQTCEKLGRDLEQLGVVLMETTYALRCTKW